MFCKNDPSSNFECNTTKTSLQPANVTRYKKKTSKQKDTFKYTITQTNLNISQSQDQTRFSTKYIKKFLKYSLNVKTLKHISKKE